VESATAISFAVLFLRHGLGIASLLYSLYTAVLIVIFFIDLEHRWILNSVTYPSMVAAMALSLITPGITLLRSILGGLIGGTIFFGLYALARAIYRQDDALGLGDVKLALLLGLMLGFPKILFALLTGTFLGALIALALLLFGRLRLQATMPYGTALTLGAYVTFVWGDNIWAWYAS